MDKFQRQLHFEKEWLGSIIKDETLLDDKTVSNFHFYNTRNKKIYDLIQKFKNKGILLDSNAWLTLSDAQLKEIGGLPYIEECKGTCIKANIDNLKRIEHELKTYHIAQSMIETVNEIKNKESYDLEECREAIQRINEVSEGIQHKRQSFKELLKQTHEELMELEEGMSGIDTGFDSLNAVFDGWQQKDLVICAARPSMCKTALTVNFFLKSAILGNETTYIPAETGNASIIKRSLAILGGLPVNAMRHPKKHLDRNGLIKYKETMQKLASLSCHVEELHNISDIKQLIRERTRQVPNKKHLVIIDHLGHISDSKMYQSRTIEFESYCLQLKNIAKEYNVCIMLLSQLSRMVEQRQDKRPMLSDLRDSGAIEQIADVIMFLYRDNYYLKQKNEQDILEIIVGKNRDGETGTTKLEFLPETNRVIELKE